MLSYANAALEPGSRLLPDGFVSFSAVLFLTVFFGVLLLWSAGSRRR